MRSFYRRSFIVLLPAVWLHTAWAADWSPDTTRILGDPAFLPLAGQVAGSFTDTYTTERYEYSSPSPFTPVSWNRTGNSFLPSLSYGITDDISMSADFGWGNTRGQESYFTDLPILRRGYLIVVPTQEHESFLSLGPSNPDFQITWRAIDQRSAPVNFDLTAGYAPDIFPAKDPGADNTGTLALGGQRGTIEASVSRETHVFTALGFVRFGYDGRTDTVQPGGAVVASTTPHADYAVGVQTETRIMPWLALNLGISAQKSAAFDQHDSPGPYVSNTITPGGAIIPYASLVVPLLGNRAAAELSYQHDFIGDEKITDAYQNTQRYNHQEENVFLVRVMFVFGVM